MNFKICFGLAVFLMFGPDSHAGLSITFRVGSPSLGYAEETAYDDDGFLDSGFTPNEITASQAIRLTMGGVRYQFASYYAKVVYLPNGGLDGGKYSIELSIPSIANLGLTSALPAANNAAADDNTQGVTVSVFANYTGFTSIANEPMRSQAAVTMQMTGGSVNNANNTSSIVYGAYYDPTDTENSSPDGLLSTFTGSANLFGAPSGSNPTAAFSGYSNVASNFTSTSFSMGVYYGVTPTSTTGAIQNSFSFTGTSFLEQTPEPSHTALPVGLACGLLVLRRRRVIP
jgi:hypothetical protein